jgi:pimeloyl-ACP methyl ester carboxylesterase
MVPMGSKTGLFAGKDHDEFTQRARDLVAEGRGDELMLMSGWWYVVTARTYLDFSTELPDTVALAPQIRCPVLFVRGDAEPAHIYPAEDFAQAAGGDCEVKIVEDCDHFYTGRAEAVGELLAGWLRKTLPAQKAEQRA